MVNFQQAKSDIASLTQILLDMSKSTLAFINSIEKSSLTQSECSAYDSFLQKLPAFNKKMENIAGSTSRTDLKGDGSKIRSSLIRNLDAIGTSVKSLSNDTSLKSEGRLQGDLKEGLNEMSKLYQNNSVKISSDLALKKTTGFTSFLSRN